MYNNRLGALPGLHLPWSCDEYMTARDVEISHFRSFRSDGQLLGRSLGHFFFGGVGEIE